MAGEINGTSIVLENGTGAIVGQMEGTLTFNGSPIDISNKSFLDNVTLLDGELAGKQLQFAGSIVYNDDTQYRKVRADSISGTQDTYTLTYTSSATTDEAFTALMVPNGLSDALPHGDKVTTSITFLSSGVITHTPAVT
ncbi:MAG TPA: hypothetical protein EYN67_15655 [Flavobacteriales bacterium]|nr:hypothetical protein [Methylococcaceae bacterium]HHZ96945.1 hypothetical protein [Flavobacteriales bacterium]